MKLKVILLFHKPPLEFADCMKQFSAIDYFYTINFLKCVAKKQNSNSVQKVYTSLLQLGNMILINDSNKLHKALMH